MIYKLRGKKFFIKDESLNTYGTVKDVRNIGILKRAQKMHVDKLVLITSGNSGYSMARLSSGKDIKVVCVVDKDIDKTVKIELGNICYKVFEEDLKTKIFSSEDIIDLVREEEKGEIVWDVTNGYEYYYGSILKEIIEEYGEPNFIVVPVGSGGIYVGLIKEIKKNNLDTKVIGIRPKERVKSLANKLATHWTPYEKDIKRFIKKGNLVFEATERQIKNTYKEYKDIVSCEASSSIVFLAPVFFSFEKSDKVVLLNTGLKK